MRLDGRLAGWRDGVAQVRMLEEPWVEALES
jgi:hypothetical protein